MLGAPKDERSPTPPPRSQRLSAAPPRTSPNVQIQSEGTIHMVRAPSILLPANSDVIDNK